MFIFVSMEDRMIEMITVDDDLRMANDDAMNIWVQQRRSTAPFNNPKLNDIPRTPKDKMSLFPHDDQNSFYTN